MQDLKSTLESYKFYGKLPFKQVAKLKQPENSIIIKTIICQEEFTRLKNFIHAKAPGVNFVIEQTVEAKVVANNIKRHAKVKNVIAVGSGKGGVGKSSVALNLAKSLNHLGAKVGILDLDVYGPNIPRMLGDLGPDNSKHSHDLVPEIFDGIQVISIGQVLASSEPILWRGPMASKVITQLFWDSDWSDLDYLILDLPPGTGDILISIAQKIPVTAAVLVTTPQSIACMDAEKASSMFKKLNISVIGFVYNMAYSLCDSCGAENKFFVGDNSRGIAEKLGVKCLIELPLDSVVAKSNEYGSILNKAWQSKFTELALAVTCSLAYKSKDRSLNMPAVSVINKEK